MPKTLILIFHPDFSRSRASRALADAASWLPNTEVFDVQSAYPDNEINVDAEVERLLAADRIVFQFPIQWYSAPPILQAWQNAVLTRMYYINYETEGRILEGKPLLIAVTAGNTSSAIRHKAPTCCHCVKSSIHCGRRPIVAACRGPSRSWFTKQ